MIKCISGIRQPGLNGRSERVRVTVNGTDAYAWQLGWLG